MNFLRFAAAVGAASGIARTFAGAKAMTGCEIPRARNMQCPLPVAKIIAAANANIGCGSRKKRIRQKKP